MMINFKNQILWQKIRNLLLLLWLVMGTIQVNAQKALQEMVYSFSLDQQQKANIKSSVIPLRLVFTIGERGEEVFAELHRLILREDGSGQVTIGKGESLFGKLEELPWSSGNIWLVTEVQLNPDNPFEIVREEKLWSVPYAFYAVESAELALPETSAFRSSGPSAYWLTSGNMDLRPPTHALGTNDNQPLIFKTDGTTERMRINDNGRLEIKAGTCCTTTNEEDEKKYPLVVEGAKHGIWIEIKSKRDKTHNFITFEDKNKTLGRIEGRTIQNWEDGKVYNNTIKLFSIEAASLATQIAGIIVEATGKSTFPCSAIQAPFDYSMVVQLGVDLVNYGIRVADWQERGRREIGVNYDTGGADYSEWLEREKGLRSLEAGQVVGIRNGKITLNTDSTSIIRVISTNPIVVGNLPSSGNTESMERVAFMGQAPVLVGGSVEQGDYLLPSGNHDGFAVAVSPEHMKIGDYASIIGVAWESGNPQKLAQLINTGIGVTNDLVMERMGMIEAKWSYILQVLDKEKGLGSLSVGPLAKNERTPLTPAMSGSEFDFFLETYREPIEYVFDYARRQLAEAGKDINQVESFALFYNDPIAFLRQTRKDPDFKTIWALFDRQYNYSNHD